MTEIAPQSRGRRRLPVEENLMQAAEKARSDAAALPAGSERDALLRKARRSETAAHMDDWINSPGLKPPT
jgi:hypothetical protein